MKASGLGLSIAVLAFGASTIYLAVQLREERANSQQLTDTTRALNARIAELEKAREGNRLAVHGIFGSANMAPGLALAAPPPPSTPAAKAGAGSEAIESVVMNGPVVQAQGAAFRKMMRANMRTYNKQMYADVGADLGLTREEASKLIDLLTDQQVVGMGIPQDVTDLAERQRLVEKEMRENKAKITDLIGASKLASLEEYQQSIPARQELDVIARQLEGSDASLSDDQRKRLLAALIEERKRIAAPAFVPGNASQQDYAKTFTDWQESYNERVAAQVRGILNTQQYAAYDEYQQWQKEMHAQMSQVHVQPGGSRNVTFFSAAPGVIVGETAVATVTSSEASPEEEPRKQP